MRCSRMEYYVFGKIFTGVTAIVRFLVFVLTMNCCATATGVKVRVGIGVVSIDGVNTENSKSVQNAINQTRLLKQEYSVYEIETIFFNFSSKFELLNSIENIFQNSDVDLVYSSLPYDVSEVLQTYSELSKKPFISAKQAPEEKCSNTFLSVSGTFPQTGEALTEFLGQFKWGNIAIFSTQAQKWHRLSMTIENNLFKNGFRVVRSEVIDDVSDQMSVLGAVSRVTTMEKAIVLSMDVEEAFQVLTHLDQWSQLTNHSVFLIHDDPYAFRDRLSNLVSLYRNISTVLESVFILFPIVPFSGTNYSNVSSFVLSTQDAVVSLMEGLVKMNESSASVDVFGAFQTLKSTYVDVWGRSVDFSSSCRRILNFELYDFDPSSMEFLNVRYIYISSTGSTTWSFREIRDIKWPKGLKVPPDQCFKDYNCLETSGVDLAVVISIPVVLIIVLAVAGIIGIWLWRKKAKILMTKGPNKIILESDDLIFLHRKDVKSSKMTNGGFLETPDLLKASEKSERSNRSLVSLHEWTEFSNMAKYKGDVVYLKELKYPNLEMKGKLLSLMRMVRDVRHENVNPLYGFYNNLERPALVSEFCSRGSLQDVIRNENLKLDWDFKVSLLTDLVRGLRFIQSSPIHYHGGLKSTNCVIDSRWVLKLTDFGLNHIREKAKIQIELRDEELLWTAPEHVRDTSPASKGSEKGDIYSFSMIMQEVILRKPPFGMLEYTPKEIIAKIRKPPPLLRPSVSPQAAQPQYIQLMKECWSENPDLRPNIEEVYQQFKHIQGGKKMNIVDSMFRMLEKYSNDLEDLVKERTTQLEEEKKKTDILLYRMLPPSVAESLKTGNRVDAETFPEVTIYFSDIVGFTTISAMSTPMQVVDLLNDLYTMFDATIDNYDVYKVETIGDAYMVASGLPIRNGNRHAGEICTMALDLLCGCGSFTIRHMPDVPLRLRIGIHTGSCVSGVVGLTMPRYCLFGDTVNTASRMESTGCAFRVQISEETKQTLDDLGGYKYEYRGEVELKGKGLAKTYWLVGKEGFSKTLPDPPAVTEIESILKNRKISREEPSSRSNSLADANEIRLVTDRVTQQDIRCACCNSPKECKRMKNALHDDMCKSTRRDSEGSMESFGSGLCNGNSTGAMEMKTLTTETITPGTYTATSLQDQTVSNHINVGSLSPVAEC